LKFAIVCWVNVGKVLFHIALGAPAPLVPENPRRLRRSLLHGLRCHSTRRSLPVVPLDPAPLAIPAEAESVDPALPAVAAPPPELLIPAEPSVAPRSGFA